MAKRSQSADGGTDPAIRPETTAVGPAPVDDLDDEIEEIPPDELDGAAGGGEVRVAPGRKVTLGAPPPPSAGPEKTRVASMDDLAPPEPPAPANAEKTMIMQNPTLPDDGHEATMIMSNPLNPAAKREVSRGKLVVVAGKEEGQSFELTDGTRVVGRSREADICLLDIQVSRRHAEVVADRNGVLVRDLGSGNGTLVNGEPVTETRLVHGDEVTIGDHVLRFEEEGPVAQALAPAGGRRGGAMVPRGPSGPPAAVPSVAAVRRARRSGGGGLDPKKKRLFIVGGATLGVLLLAVIVKVAVGPAKRSGPPKLSRSQLAVQDFNAGLTLFKKSDYADALAKFQGAAQADPNLAKAQEYVKATKREMAAAAAIKRGDGLLADGKYDQARAAYKSVGQDSLRYGDAQAALKRVDQAEAAKSVSEGRQSLAAGQLDDADQAFHHALSVIPDDADAQAGLKAVEEQRQALAEKAKMTAAQRRRLRAQQRRLAHLRHVKAVHRALAPGVRQFDAGSFRRAADTFGGLVASSSDHDVRRLAARKKRAIRRFLPAYNQGMSAPANRPSRAALSALATAYQQAGVVDPSSPIRAKIQRKLGKLYYLKGRVAYNAKRYPVAFRSWRRAIRFDPSLSLAQSGLTDLNHLAKKLYLQAYIQKTVNRSAAIHEWKQVIAMTPPGNDYHQKAQQRLQEIGAN